MENPILQAIEERRSVKRYSNRRVDEETLRKILRAGTYAPSGMNRQSPILVAVEDEKTLAVLRRMNAALLGRAESDPFYGAQTVVVVLADRRVSTCVEDGSLVMGNLMLAAHALGVDSCWIHRAKQEFESEEGKALLKSWGISGDYVGVGHCILGYCEGERPAPPPRKPASVYHLHEDGRVTVWPPKNEG